MLATGKAKKKVIKGMSLRELKLKKKRKESNF
jgi:hypothetical protein